jgi:hypothetical protein
MSFWQPGLHSKTKKLCLKGKQNKQTNKQTNKKQWLTIERASLTPEFQALLLTT